MLWSRPNEAQQKEGSMDPDIVRQQEEAEREALMLLARQQLTPAARKAATDPAAATMGAPFYFEAGPASQANPELMAAGTAQLPAMEGQLEAMRPLRPRAAPARPPIWLAAFETAGRFVSFGVAGAMLGGGLGIVAANYFDLSVELAKAAIFGPAGVAAACCAIMSFFANGAMPQQRLR
jgi:hypothetical protein